MAEGLTGSLLIAGSWTAGVAGATGRLVDTGRPEVVSPVVREPVGVCALITPWKYPLLQISWKVAPAFAAGCTVVVKPSELIR